MAWAGKTAVYGCDYNKSLVNWCKKQLPWAKFATNNLQPPLPYPNETFDLIYALSVFTHFPEAMQSKWLEELRRALKPGGLLFITTHGDFYLDQLTPEEQRRFAQGLLVTRETQKAGQNDCAAFHPLPYLQKQMTHGFTLLDHVPQGAKGNPKQDATLLQKK